VGSHNSTVVGICVAAASSWWLALGGHPVERLGAMVVLEDEVDLSLVLTPAAVPGGGPRPVSRAQRV